MIARRLVPPYIDSDVPDEAGDQLGLWAPTCLACSGAGTIRLELELAGVDARATCPQCNGTGIAAVARKWPA